MLTSAAWSIQYFNARVQQNIESWPDGIYADFLRLISLMENHGADLRMPHSRAMGQGLFDDTEMRIARKRLKGLRNV